MQVIRDYFLSILNDSNAMIAQGLGLIAVIITFISFQASSRKRILMLQVISSTIFAIGYFILGEFTGAVINLIAVVRNILFYNKENKYIAKLGWGVPIILAVAMVIAGIFAWTDWYSILFIVVLAVNTICFAVPDAQFMRKSILVTSPLVLVYNIFARSVPGVFNETIALVSSIIGIIRHVKNKRKEELPEKN